MDGKLLAKLFGTQSAWHGPCLILVDADATVNTYGTDSIVTGGTKLYAPRIISGRVQADAVCFLPEHQAMLVLQRRRQRKQTGEEVHTDSLMLVSTHHIVGIEFDHTDLLEVLGVDYPALPEKNEYAPGTLVG